MIDSTTKSSKGQAGQDWSSTAGCAFVWVAGAMGLDGLDLLLSFVEPFFAAQCILRSYLAVRQECAVLCAFTWAFTWGSVFVGCSVYAFAWPAAVWVSRVCTYTHPFPVGWQQQGTYRRSCIFLVVRLPVITSTAYTLSAALFRPAVDGQTLLTTTLVDDVLCVYCCRVWGFSFLLVRGCMVELMILFVEGKKTKVRDRHSLQAHNLWRASLSAAPHFAWV